MLLQLKNRVYLLDHYLFVFLIIYLSSFSSVLPQHSAPQSSRVEQPSQEGESLTKGEMLLRAVFGITNRDLCSQQQLNVYLIHESFAVFQSQLL